MTSNQDLPMGIETEGTSSNTLSALRHAAGTDIGMRREENQDSFGVIESPLFKFYIVADGMGGVQGGATASGMAVSIVEGLLKNKEDLNETSISTAVSVANQMIYEKGVNNAALNGMGTTFVGLAFVGERLYITNVGDSRAYRFRAGKVQRLTEDHTLVMELVRSGTITMEQAGNHPVSHMLTRSLGPTPEIEVDCFLDQDGPNKDDKYLLCSDGLYNLVSEDEMLEVLSTKSLDESIDILIDLANQRGGSDNVTIIVIEVGQSGAISSAAHEASHNLETSTQEAQSTNGHLGAKQPKESASNTAVQGSAETSITDELQDEYYDSDDQIDDFEDIDPFAIPQDPPTKAAKPEDSVDQESAEAEEEISDKTAGSAESDGFASVSSESARTTLRENPVIAGGISIDNLVEHEEASEASNQPSTTVLVKAGSLFSRLFGDKLSAKSLVFIGLFFGFLGGGLFVALFDGQPAVAPVASLPPVVEIQDAGPKVINQEAELVDPLTNSFDTTLSLKAPEVEAIDIESVNVRELPSTDEIASSNRDPAVISGSTRDNLLQRQESLKRTIQQTEKQLEMFDKPLSGEFAESLRSETAKREALNSEMSSIRSEIDSATFRLTVWYKRRSNIQDTDLTNLATQVAVTSEEVKKKKEAFEMASWNYLKEVEVLRYLPTDRQQKKKVEELVEVRNEKLHEMAIAVQKAIDLAIQESEARIAESTLRREKINEEIENLTHEIDFIKILIGNDVSAKSKKKKELQKELESARSELSELETLLQGPAPVFPKEVSPPSP